MADEKKGITHEVAWSPTPADPGTAAQFITVVAPGADELNAEVLEQFLQAVKALGFPVTVLAGSAWYQRAKEINLASDNPRPWPKHLTGNLYPAMLRGIPIEFSAQVDVDHALVNSRVR